MTVLQERANQLGWRLERCRYGADGVELIRQLLYEVALKYWHGEFATQAERHAPDPVSADLDAGSAEVDEETQALGRALEHLRRALMREAPLIKDKAFVAEREWRLISPPIDGSAKDIAFRPGASFLVPYVTFPYYVQDQPCIQQLTAGPTPNPQLSLPALKSFADHLGSWSWLVKSSDAPYRPW